MIEVSESVHTTVTKGMQGEKQWWWREYWLYMYVAPS